MDKQTEMEQMMNQYLEHTYKDKNVLKVQKCRWKKRLQNKDFKGSDLSLINMLEYMIYQKNTYNNFIKFIMFNNSINMPVKTGTNKGLLTTAEIRRLISAHNKLSKIVVPKGTDREGLEKLIKSRGYKINHKQQRLDPQPINRPPLKTVTMPPKKPRKVAVVKPPAKKVSVVKPADDDPYKTKKEYFKLLEENKDLLFPSGIYTRYKNDTDGFGKNIVKELRELIDKIKERKEKGYTKAELTDIQNSIDTFLKPYTYIQTNMTTAQSKRNMKSAFDLFNKEGINNDPVFRNISKYFKDMFTSLKEEGKGDNLQTLKIMKKKLIKPLVKPPPAKKVSVVKPDLSKLNSQFREIMKNYKLNATQKSSIGDVFDILSGGGFDKDVTSVNISNDVLSVKRTNKPEFKLKLTPKETVVKPPPAKKVTPPKPAQSFNVKNTKVAQVKNKPPPVKKDLYPAYVETEADKKKDKLIKDLEIVSTRLKETLLKNKNNFGFNSDPVNTNKDFKQLFEQLVTQLHTKDIKKLPVSMENIKSIVNTINAYPPKDNEGIKSPLIKYPALSDRTDPKNFKNFINEKSRLSRNKILKERRDALKPKKEEVVKKPAVKKESVKKESVKKESVKKVSVKKPPPVEEDDESDSDYDEDEEPREITAMNDPLTKDLIRVVQLMRNQLLKEGKENPSKLTSRNVIIKKIRPIRQFIRDIQRKNNVEFSEAITTKYESEFTENLIDDLMEIGGLKK